MSSRRRKRRKEMSNVEAIVEDTPKGKAKINTALEYLALLFGSFWHWLGFLPKRKKK